MLKKGSLIEMENEGREKSDLREFIPEYIIRIKERFLGKKILLYGLNDDTKKAIMLLASYHIPIEGFLCSPKEDKFRGMKYLGKSFLGLDDISEMDFTECVVLDVYGDNLEEIRKIFNMSGEALFQVPPEVMIYGAGANGKRLWELFARLGVKICCYCDKDNKKREWMDNDCRVILPAELNLVQKTMPVLISVQDAKAVYEIRKILDRENFSRVHCFSLHFFRKVGMVRKKEKYVPVLAPWTLKYFRHKLPEWEKDGKKVYFYTSDISHGLETLLEMELLGIPVGNVRIATETDIHYEADPRICNAYDLLYEKYPCDLIICALPDDEDDAKNFMKESGLPTDIFTQFLPGMPLLRKRYVLDTHLGYADDKGVFVVRNCGKDEPALRVAIFGGSTSDYNLYIERSWPSWLLELAVNVNVKMECFMAATAGYMSAQELIRLIRDVIWKKPDIVISYSAINDVACVEKYCFTHNYQKFVFDNISRYKEYNYNGFKSEMAAFSMGEVRLDEGVAVNWLMNERMMHAICQEFGIDFYCFLQTWLYDKKIQSRRNLELIEHDYYYDYYDAKKEIQELHDLVEYVKNEKTKYSWLYDFTGIFDGVREKTFFDNCHVYSEANRLLAQNILAAILKKRGENI